MRTRFTQDPGVSFRAISLPTGPMRGIEIDNPSGSWLYIPSLETFVPPYIVGWSYSFPYDVTAIDIIANQDGPAGQPSTSDGDPVIVFLTDESIATSEGTPAPGKEVRPLTTPVLNLYSEIEVPYANSTITLISAASVLGKMVRIYGFRFWYSINLSAIGGVSRNIDTAVSWWLRGTPTGAAPFDFDEFIGGTISREHPVDVVDFGYQPRDIIGTPVQGHGVTLTTRPAFAATLCIYQLRYALM